MNVGFIDDVGFIDVIRSRPRGVRPSNCHDSLYPFEVCSMNMKSMNEYTI